ncbi:hypothetical protein [Streptomyces sp. NPDC008317]|uniref:hypothetical protein n=1 Tax=Streptomyces sp. NPDC008317 TaxID=3364827 RepID=UPI0036E110D4
MTNSRPYVPQDPYGPPQPHEWQHGAGTRPQVRQSPVYGPAPVMPPFVPRFRPPDHDSHAYVAPLIATVLGGPVIAFCGLIAMFSPMATDSCTPNGCQALTTMLLVAPAVLLLAVVALVVSWALPWRLRHRTTRAVASLAAPLLAVTTLLIYIHLPAAG